MTTTTDNDDHTKSVEWRGWTEQPGVIRGLKMAEGNPLVGLSSRLVA